MHTISTGASASVSAGTGSITASIQIVSSTLINRFILSLMSDSSQHTRAPRFSRVPARV